MASEAAPQSTTWKSQESTYSKCKGRGILRIGVIFQPTDSIALSVCTSCSHQGWQGTGENSLWKGRSG